MTGKSKIIFTFYLSIFILITIGFFAYQNTNEFKNSEDWINQTHQINFRAQRMLNNIQRIEAITRGYVITGEEKHLNTFKEGLNNVENLYLLTKSLLKDDPKQQILLDSIQSTINLKIDFVKNVVSVRQENGFESAQQLVSKGVGEKLMIKTRELVGNFIQSGNDMLTAQLEEANQKYSAAINQIIISILISIIFIFTTLYLFIIEYNKRIYFEKKLLEYKYFFNNSYDLACVANMQGYFEIVNPNWEKVLGYTSKELLEKSFLYFVHPEDIEFTLKEVENLKTGAITINFTNRFRKKDGNYLWFQWNGTPDRLTGKLYAIARDVTENKIAQESIIKAKEAAEQANLLTKTFLANMSHEIRTPMNAIIGFSDILFEKNLGNREKEYVKTIKLAGENLLTIINDILDISKIEAGMITFEETHFSVKETFESLNAMLIEKAKEKNIELSFVCDENVPNVVLGDQTRLTQIIINLAGNAIKFTQKGKVQVTAKVSEMNENVLLEFSVKDTGIGIPPDKLEHIFERFQQAESHTTRKYGGTGLGLSIAKQLVELQGGTLSVKSELKKGSVFSFCIPYKKSTQILTKSNIIEKKYNMQDLNKLKVLLVEDDKLNIKLISYLFSENNLKLQVAENGSMCIEALKENNGSTSLTRAFDIILMDMEMPVMNGYEATIIIRKELKNNVPIIAMTAHAMAGEKEKCLSLGMNDYISKPINSNQLFEKMNELIVISEETLSSKS